MGSQGREHSDYLSVSLSEIFTLHIGFFVIHRTTFGSLCWKNDPLHMNLEFINVIGSILKGINEYTAYFFINFD